MKRRSFLRFLGLGASAASLTVPSFAVGSERAQAVPPFEVSSFELLVSRELAQSGASADWCVKLWPQKVVDGGQLYDTPLGWTYLFRDIANAGVVVVQTPLHLVSQHLLIEVGDSRHLAKGQRVGVRRMDLQFRFHGYRYHPDGTTEPYTSEAL